jgi:hypothetical protein
MGTQLRRILMPIATLFVAIPLIGVLCTGRVLAGEMKVISSDANARFVALGISKAIVIDLPTAVTDVLVADPSIVAAVVKSERRVYVIGAAVGQTNVYFFDASGRQIDGLNVAVLTHSEQAELETYPFPAQTVMVYLGGLAAPSFGVFVTWSCTPFRCVFAGQPGVDQPPGTQNINITGNAGGSVIVPPK